MCVCVCSRCDMYWKDIVDGWGSGAGHMAAALLCNLSGRPTTICAMSPGGSCLMMGTMRASSSGFVSFVWTTSSRTCTILGRLPKSAPSSRVSFLRRRPRDQRGPRPTRCRRVPFDKVAQQRRADGGFENVIAQRQHGQPGG